MRRTWASRLTCTLAAGSVILVLAGCSTNPVELVRDAIGSPTLEEGASARRAAVGPAVSSPTLVTDGVLTVGLKRSSAAPMVITGSDGSFQGYDVDTAYAIAERMGLAVEFKSVADANSATGCDVVMDVAAGESNSMTVMGSYAEEATAFFHRGPQTTASKNDISGKRVGVQGGSSSEQLLKRSDLDATIRTFPNLNEAFEALESGSVDYVLCDAFSGDYLQGSYTDISLAGTIDAPAPVGVGVASGNAELQAAVKDAVNSVSSGGVSTILRRKWLGGASTLGSASQISGITIRAGSTSGADADSAEVVGGSSGARDGSTAGALAVDIS